MFVQNGSDSQLPSESGEGECIDRVNDFWLFSDVDNEFLEVLEQVEWFFVRFWKIWLVFLVSFCVGFLHDLRSDF